MVTSNSSEQPAWQRNPIFEFFASLKLAMVLLTMLIIAAIAGTLYESSFDAKVARGYVYGAPRQALIAPRERRMSMRPRSAGKLKVEFTVTRGRSGI